MIAYDYGYDDITNQLCVITEKAIALHKAAGSIAIVTLFVYSA